MVPRHAAAPVESLVIPREGLNPKAQAFSDHAAACTACRDVAQQQVFELDELCGDGAELWEAFIAPLMAGEVAL